MSQPTAQSRLKTRLDDLESDGRVKPPPLKIETLHEYDEKTRLRSALPVNAEHYPNTEMDAIVVAACSARKILVEGAVAAARAVKDWKPSQLQ